MAVLQMQRISICAMKKNRKAILERLQELGAMEIDIRLPDDSDYQKKDVASSKATFEKQAQTADHALEILQEYVPEKAGLLASLNGKPLIDRGLFSKAARGQDNYIETARRIVALDKQIAEQKANIQKLQNQMEALVPWMGLTVPVSYTGTRKTSVLIGTIAGTQGLPELYGLLAKGAPEVDALDIQVISTDKDYTYLAVVCLKRSGQEVLQNRLRLWARFLQSARRSFRQRWMHPSGRLKRWRRRSGTVQAADRICAWYRIITGSVRKNTRSWDGFRRRRIPLP